MNRNTYKRGQTGRALLLSLVLIAVLIGAGWYHKRSTRMEALAAAAAASAAEAAQRAREQAEVERRLAEARREADALRAALSAVDDLTARWEDAFKIASSTSRIALSAPVATLQGLRREAEKLTVPPCLDVGKPRLVAAMDSTVDGFVTFMRNDLKLGGVLSNLEFEKAATAMKEFRDARKACPG